YPTLFAKFSGALVGAYDDIHLPPEDDCCDWEGELAVVIGSNARRTPRLNATECIAGYSIANDVSMRGYQMRTTQWLQGKTWEKSTPIGPWLVSPDEYDPCAKITTLRNVVVVQSDSVEDTIFAVDEVISYISDIVTLEPGDIIITGTPVGVGAGMRPAEYLKKGDILETRISGLGRQRNVVVQDD